jgi:hypothetical protein
MGYPEIVIYPDEYAIYQIGVRLRQLELFHWHALKVRSPYLPEDCYDRLIEIAWREICSFDCFSADATKEIGGIALGLQHDWNYGRKCGFELNKIMTRQQSQLPGDIANEIALIDRELQGALSLLTWFRLGLCEVDPKNWAP